MKKLSFLTLTIILASCNCTKKASTTLIQDCPDEKIVDKMPTVGESNTPKEYYIYKGERKEIKDFDAAWVSKNCNVKTTTVH
ncbi:hypothetical protein NAT51_11315 [Flavobacterium amniphilum]|uniref:hypothetical protein n=1 Tax=Flavobacterium amniphilum TaxID=1834035 RepID=UPI002029B8AE|nr:hypothetical protein [Flavobacterium amniphilum]MCL9806117.1 hypothetical protein [Flavobacterium amniphilum]